MKLSPVLAVLVLLAIVGCMLPQNAVAQQWVTVYPAYDNPVVVYGPPVVVYAPPPRFYQEEVVVPGHFAHRELFHLLPYPHTHEWDEWHPGYTYWRWRQY